MFAAVRWSISFFPAPWIPTQSAVRSVILLDGPFIVGSMLNGKLNINYEKRTVQHFASFCRWIAVNPFYLRLMCRIPILFHSHMCLSSIFGSVYKVFFLSPLFPLLFIHLFLNTSSSVSLARSLTRSLRTSFPVWISKLKKTHIRNELFPLGSIVIFLFHFAAGVWAIAFFSVKERRSPRTIHSSVNCHMNFNGALTEETKNKD